MSLRCHIGFHAWYQIRYLGYGLGDEGVSSRIFRCLRCGGYQRKDHDSHVEGAIGYSRSYRITEEQAHNPAPPEAWRKANAKGWGRG